MILLTFLGFSFRCDSKCVSFQKQVRTPVCFFFLVCSSVYEQIRHWMRWIRQRTVRAQQRAKKRFQKILLLWVTPILKQEIDLALHVICAQSEPVKCMHSKLAPFAFSPKTCLLLQKDSVAKSRKTVCVGKAYPSFLRPPL